MILFLSIVRRQFLVFSREIRIILRMNLGFFQTLEGLFRFLEITKRHGLEIGGAFFPFSKRWVNTPFKFKNMFYLYNRPRI